LIVFVNPIKIITRCINKFNKLDSIYVEQKVFGLWI
jgi:hypothetical protein